MTAQICLLVNHVLVVSTCRNHVLYPEMTHINHQVISNLIITAASAMKLEENSKQEGRRETQESFA